MHMPFFQNEINLKLMEALLYTLMHTLWMGAIAAVAAAIIVMATRHSKPQLRYNLLCVLLIVFYAGTGLILRFEMAQSTLHSAALPAASLISDTDSIDITFQSAVHQSISMKEVVIQIISKYSFLFVGAWFLVVVYKLVWFSADFKTLKDIRHSGIISPGNDWEQRLSFLASGIGIHSHVQLKLSTATTVPMVIGIFKPVIIFPLALFNSLSTVDAEAILLHELAHIRRHDFFINILQRVTEIIFFFNPPIRWISELIRRERENCCDDIAISAMSDKKQYIYALVAFQEHHLNHQQGSLLTAFPGDGHQVFNRVNRILTNHNKSLNKMEKVFLAAAIFVTGIVTLAFSNQEKSVQTFPQKENTVAVKNQEPKSNAVQNEKEQKLIPEQITTGRDTIPRNSTVKRMSIMVYSTNINGKEYEMHKNENEIVQLKIDGKEIPLSQLNHHRAVLDTIDRRIDRDEQEMEQHFLELKLNQELFNQKNEALLENQINFDQLQKMQIENNMMLQDKMRVLEELQVENLLKNKKSALDAEAFKDLSLIYQKQLKELALTNELFPLKEKLLSDQYLNLAKVEKEHELAMMEHEIAMVKQQEALREHSKGMEIIEELVEEGIIKDSRNLKLKLTNEELIINGKKQPAELHLKMLKKFQDKPGAKVNLEYNILN